MASAGIIPGMITCLLSGAIAALGLFFLSKCSAKAPHRRASFFALSQMTFPNAAVFFDAAVVIKCFGVSIRCACDPHYCSFHPKKKDSRADGTLLLQLSHNIESADAFGREGFVPRLVTKRPPGVDALGPHLDIRLYDSARPSVLLEEPTLSPTY
jgi:Transmembrane amino acid transporter protein